MHTALLISSPPRWPLGLARRWATAGDQVTVVLLDGAAAAARDGTDDQDAVTDAIAAGAQVRAVEDALTRRGIRPDRLVEGVKPTDLDAVADLIVDGADKVVWL